MRLRRAEHAVKEGQKEGCEGTRLQASPALPNLTALPFPILCLKLLSKPVVPFSLKMVPKKVL